MRESILRSKLRPTGTSHRRTSALPNIRRRNAARGIATGQISGLHALLPHLLASWIGTTGAAMIMIRPIIRANEWRKNKVHIIVFFIFLVANMGGCPFLFAGCGLVRRS